MSIFTRAFLAAAFERAIKTFFQAGVALISVAGLGFLDIDWVQVASVAGLAAVVSLATSIASNQIGPVGPSLANEVAVPYTLG